MEKARPSTWTRWAKLIAQSEIDFRVLKANIRRLAAGAIASIDRRSNGPFFLHAGARERGRLHGPRRAPRGAGRSN